jgi:hypothetical protein
VKKQQPFNLIFSIHLKLYCNCCIRCE